MFLGPLLALSDPNSIENVRSVYKSRFREFLVSSSINIFKNTSRAAIMAKLIVFVANSVDIDRV